MLATQKINFCNIKKHVLKHITTSGCKYQNFRHNIIALFHATSIQIHATSKTRVLQHQIHAGATWKKKVVSTKSTLKEDTPIAT